MENRTNATYPAVATGGSTFYGAAVGILMLDTRFPRIHGDIGHASTWPFPVHYHIVRNASPGEVVYQHAENTLDLFIEAARTLAAEGVGCITTSCGFLCLVQNTLNEAVSVPVITSSLVQVPLINEILPSGKRAGILTISNTSLSDDHLKAVNIPLDTPVASTEGRREFTRAILGNEEQMNIELARQDNIEAAMELSNNDDIGAIVLECTNMIPYASDIKQATGLPIFSIYTIICWLQAGIIPPRF